MIENNGYEHPRQALIRLLKSQEGEKEHEGHHHSQ